MITELEGINKRLDDLTERINELLRRVGGTAPVPAPTNPAPSLPIAHPPGWVPTASGRYLPAPQPTDGNFMGYCGRIASAIGKGDMWLRTAGTLFHGSDHLVPRSVPYPDGYRAYKSDPANWPDMADKFYWPTPEATDPAWQQVYDRMGQQR